jgi:hypothetical protein
VKHLSAPTNIFLEATNVTMAMTTSSVAKSTGKHYCFSYSPSEPTCFPPTDSTSVSTSIMTATQTTTKEQSSPTYSTSSSQFDTVASSLFPQSTTLPVSQYCNTSVYIGLFCNVSNNLCDMLKCQNYGTCNSIDNNQRYKCLCLPGFNGTDCEFDHGPCKPYTCLDHGTYLISLYILLGP